MSDPHPLELAQAALTRLIASGAPPARVKEAVGAVVAGWADEPDMTPEIARDRIERLWDGFSRDAAELQEQLADADGNQDAAALGGRVLAATKAAAETLAVALGVR